MSQNWSCCLASDTTPLEWSEEKKKRKPQWRMHLQMFIEPNKQSNMQIHRPTGHFAEVTSFKGTNTAQVQVPLCHSLEFGVKVVWWHSTLRLVSRVSLMSLICDGPCQRCPLHTQLQWSACVPVCADVCEMSLFKWDFGLHSWLKHWLSYISLQLIMSPFN